MKQMRLRSLASILEPSCKTYPTACRGKKHFYIFTRWGGLNEWDCEGWGGLGLCHSLIHSVKFLKEAVTVGLSGLTDFTP